MEQEFSPETLLQAITYFSDVDVATDFMVRLRWPDGVICPRCQGRNVLQLARVTRAQSRRIWNCRDCRRQFGVKVGTVMEDSPIGLDKWLPAFWLLTSAKNGISSCELARALGITQKSAWFVLHRIRLVMAQGSFEKMRREPWKPMKPLSAVLRRTNTKTKAKRERSLTGSGQSHSGHEQEDAPR